MIYIIHTSSSLILCIPFQGREAEAVVLSVVRDGGAGMGFVDDERRLAVALTRARTTLIVVASNVDAWPEACKLKQMARGVGVDDVGKK